MTIHGVMPFSARPYQTENGIRGERRIEATVAILIIHGFNCSIHAQHSLSFFRISAPSFIM